MSRNTDHGTALNAERQAKVRPIKIQFKYPWLAEPMDVDGLMITRVVPIESQNPEVFEMDDSTPPPTHPSVICIQASLTRIDDWRFKETTIHIPFA